MATLFTVSECSLDSYTDALTSLRERLTEPLHYLQAPFYGAWQQASGKRVIYYQIKRNETLIGCGLAIHYTFPHIKNYGFLYSPYGPALTETGSGVNRALRAFFKSTAKNYRSAFVRLDTSPLPGSKTTANALAATASLQPRKEWVLDITPSEDQLLTDLHKMARYHVRLAEREHVKVSIHEPDVQYVDEFYSLMQATSERNDFGIMDRDYYQAVFAALDSENAFVALCYVGDNLAAAALFITYEQQSHYVFAASSNEYRKLAPSYFLQWQAILEAKRRGCTLHNFGGIEDNVKKLHLAGVEKFKKRFGGYAIDHPNPVDIVTNPLAYGLFGLYKRLSY